ncbi:MAG: nucleotidyltransferase family protein [Candidatus Thorarchaeota archaeon]|jgi:hypothetical protein
MFEFALKNNLLLAFGEKINNKKDIPQPFRNIYNNKMDFKNRALNIIQRLLMNCQEHDLMIMTIKSIFPYPYIDTNIDFVVVRPVDIQKIIKILDKMDYKRQYSLADIREPNKKMYYHRKKLNLFPQLHLHEEISWNGVNYLENKNVWDRHKLFEIKHYSIPVPSPEDEILIMAAHTMFENKYITMGDLFYFYTLSFESVDWDYIFRSAQLKSWEKALDIFLFTAYKLLFLLGYPIELDMKIKHTFYISDERFPYVLPLSQTLNATYDKFVADFDDFRVGVSLRQLFSYFIVDPFWMYYKAYQQTKKEIA